MLRKLGAGNPVAAGSARPDPVPESIFARHAGVRLAAVGLLLGVLGAIGTAQTGPWHPVVTSILINLGTGLLAAGVVTYLLEPSARQRHREDVRELREAHIRAILEGIVDDDVFEQLDQQVLQHRYIRRNCSVDIELDTREAPAGHLWKRQTLTFELQNLSDLAQTYDWNWFEDERATPQGDRPIVEFQRVVVEQAGNATISFSAEQLKDLVERDGAQLSLVTRIPLKGKEVCSCSATVCSLMPVRDIYYFGLITPTKGLWLTVWHSDGLEVTASLMHPTRWTMAPIAPVGAAKKWHTPIAFLPYQGIELSWRPAS